MPPFAYRAVDAAGRRRTGHVDAPTPRAAAQALEERGLVVLDVAGAPGEDGGEQATFGRESGSGAARRRDALDATRALAALLPAGLPLARALAAAETTTSAPMAARLATIRERVERGDALATALAAQPDLFSPIYVGVVRAGERSGDLAGAFARLAVQLERDEELRERLLSAAIYPSLIAVVGGVAVLVLLLVVLPRFAALLEGAGATLPRSTAILLAVATGGRAHWPLLVLPLVLLAAAGVWTRTSAAGARALSAALLALPLAGPLRRQVLAARFARLMAVLLGGGAPLLAALEDTADSLGDPLARAETARIRARVREGAALHRAVDEGTLFPPLLARLVAVGEESGRLQEFLAKAADVLDQRVQRSTARLVALAEPAMIVVFGIAVGFVALSLLQAIYGVNAAAFRGPGGMR